MSLAEQEEVHPDILLADAVGTFYSDPLGFVVFAFPWDTHSEIQIVPWDDNFPKRLRDRYPHLRYGPDEWACDQLDAIGAAIKKRKFNGRDAVDPIQRAIASGHGIGKTTFTAWVVLWIMSTRAHAKGVVTANTAEQLKTKTWAEVGKWHKLCLTAHWFEYNSGRGSMSLYSKAYPESWRCDAQTCREENSEAFAGLHSASSTPFFIFDEASAVPDKISEVAQGGTTDGEPIWLQFGNPTRNTGFFHAAFGRLRHRWETAQIDSRTVRITNKDRISQWVDDYGEDSDFVRVRVKGEFPRAGDLQFIPADIVEEAQQREVVEDHRAPLVIGVDVARFGSDESVIYPRIGRDARSFPAKRFRELDTVQLSARVVETMAEFRRLGRETNALFVDGGGVGGGVVDLLRGQGYDVTEINFGGKASSRDYRFKGDEMWAGMKEALENWLCIPEDLDLEADLTGREYGYTLSSQLQLEKKDDMKKRGLSSPDLADALALTFARPVAPRMISHPDMPPGGGLVSHDYDPLHD